MDFNLHDNNTQHKLTDCVLCGFQLSCVLCGFQLSSSKSLLLDPGRPVPMTNLGVRHGVKHHHFPDSVDKVPQTQAYVDTT